MELLSQLAFLDGRREAMIERVVQWANINSNSFNVSGLERLATLVSQAFLELECKSETYFLKPIEEIDPQGGSSSVDLGPVLRFWKRAEAPIQVLLVGHMDTVFKIDHPFQKCIRRSDKIINGPGVSDMKGGLCVMLEALRAFEQLDESEQLGWEVIINSDEEIGSLGSSAILKERAKAHQFGLLFEPAVDEKGTLAGQRKGSGKFSIVVHGREAHAGRHFSKGRNAITCLADIVSKIDALNQQKEGLTINVGRISGGGSVNVVPASAVCHLDIRIVDASDEEWIQSSLKKIISSANEKEGFEVELKGSFGKKPKILTPEVTQLYELVANVGEALGQSITWEPSGGVCDGNTLFSAGLPNVDTLGVCGGGIHSEEEYLLVDSLITRLKLTTGVLLQLSQKNPKNDKLIIGENNDNDLAPKNRSILK